MADCEPAEVGGEAAGLAETGDRAKRLLRQPPTSPRARCRPPPDRADRPAIHRNLTSSRASHRIDYEFFHG
ncbi:hypothetical protein GUJ93_ZPchr0013g37422 [Zizania palustris]|uniref:Uncharacterized protein n=1 Tax=Zizania palustris TaxID=103762 RepID=A0A8J6C2U1_ZIZPA|nr:hypothetical protein GUJ93_ZPchr0013g37422 [Zizania palustris]